MAQHVSSSFINNFFGVRDPQLLGRILTNDRLPTALALLQIAAGPLVALGLRRVRGGASERLRPRTASLLLLLIVVLVALPAWFRPSEKRWRRIRPAAVAIAADAAKQVLGKEEPGNPARGPTRPLSPRSGWQSRRVGAPRKSGVSARIRGWCRKPDADGGDGSTSKHAAQHRCRRLRDHAGVEHGTRARR